MVHDTALVSGSQAWVFSQESRESFHWQSDDVREAAADHGHERVVVLNAVGPRLTLPAPRVEKRGPLDIVQDSEPHDARLDRPRPFPRLGPDQTHGGEDL